MLSLSSRLGIMVTLVGSCLFFILIGGSATSRADAQQEEENAAGADKSCYSLFNPTPDGLMRAFRVDRPTKSDDATTIDAGHFAFESGLISYIYNALDHSASNKAKQQINVMETELRLGLLNSVELQMLLQPFIWQEKQGRAGHGSEDAGFGDIQFRLKVNLWGNEGGPTALALIPYVSTPTSSDHIGIGGTEGGLLVPLVIVLPMGWEMDLETGGQAARNDSGRGYHPDWIAIATLSHSLIVKDLQFYVETYSQKSFGHGGGGWIGTVDTGLAYKLNKNIQLDAGVNIGVSHDADDINPFVGLSWRF